MYLYAMSLTRAFLVFGAMVFGFFYNRYISAMYTRPVTSTMGRPLYISTSQGSNGFIFVLCSKACSAALSLYNHQLTHNGLIYYSE